MAAILRPIVLLLLFALSACTALQQRKPEGVSFLAFGDSGYHYDYLKKKVRQNPLTVEGYLAARRKKWIGKQLPQEEFEAPPIHIVPGTRQAVEASGARPVAEAMYSFCARDDCQFALMLGDNIYPAGATGTGDEIRFRKILEEPYRKLVESRAGFRLYAVLGNHDWKTSRAGRQRQIEYGERSDTAFTLESPGYYSFVRGDVEFFAIDTNLLLAGTRVKKGELNPDGSEKESGEPDVPKRWELPGGGDRRQLRWLEQALKHSRAGWKVVFGHHPLWSAGGGKFEQARSLRRLIGPLICRYADIYLAGHEHDLELNLDSCRA
ncbi:MAG TPA: hypothetical protein ENI96_11185, partial [Sedimenticola thiotaurini]|nr:hypothetical protein [Sedimenticola thiotaurini]